MSAERELERIERRALAAREVTEYGHRVAVLRELFAIDDEPSLDTARGLVLALQPPQVETVALTALLDGYAAGARDALAIVDEAFAVEQIARAGRPSAAARALVDDLDDLAIDLVETAQRLARAGARIDAVLAPLFRLANAITSRVTAAVNMAGNEGTTAVANAVGLATVWVAEYNACVHCLRYSGVVARPGGTFPGGLTYGAKAFHTAALPHPPLHPHCRCTVEPLNDPEYAAALRREADRSVLRGFSLESESMAVRIDAASRLIENGVDAPASVIRYGLAAVRRGEFTRRGR